MAPKHVAFAPAIQKQLGSRLRSPLFGEEPCPLSLSHGFFTIQPSPCEGSRNWGLSPISPEDV